MNKKTEAKYHGNLGFEEMMIFYRKANATQKKQLEHLINQNKVSDAWKLVQQVTGMSLEVKEIQTSLEKMYQEIFK